MKEKRPAGRPTLKTDATVEILLECLRSAMPVKRACEFAKIDTDTFYKWLKSDRDLSVKVAYAKAHSIRGLIAATVKKDPWKILKNVDSEHFKDVVDVNQKETHRLVIDPGDGEPEEFGGF